MPTIHHTKRPWVKARAAPVIASKPDVGPDLHPNFYRHKAWRALRQQTLDEEPLCRTCYEKGVLTPSVIGDHIVPIKQGGAPLERSNTQGLCDSCHQKKRAQERGDRYKKKTN